MGGVPSERLVVLTATRERTSLLAGHRQLQLVGRPRPSSFTFRVRSIHGLSPAVHRPPRFWESQQTIGLLDDAVPLCPWHASAAPSGNAFEPNESPRVGPA